MKAKANGAPKDRAAKYLPAGALTLADLAVEWDGGTFEKPEVHRLTGAQLAQLIEFCDEAFGGAMSAIDILTDVESVSAAIGSVAEVLDEAVSANDRLSIAAMDVLAQMAKVQEARCTILRPDGPDGRRFRVCVDVSTPPARKAAA